MACASSRVIEYAVILPLNVALVPSKLPDNSNATPGVFCESSAFLVEPM
jgi:hypothetical protein